MDKKALQLAISTLILIILGLVILVGLILFVTGGFEKFKETSDPFLDSTRTSSIKQACGIACDGRDRFAFCCNEFELDEGTVIKCDDSRLEIECSLDCSNFECEE